MEYEKAKKRVEAIKGFYVHLTIFVVVISFLFIVNLLTGNTWWFYWPMLGWGVALVIHGSVILFAEGVLGENWEEKKIKELMRTSGK